MRKMTTATMLAVAVSMPFSANAKIPPEMQLTGAGFLEICTRSDERWLSFCNGYIQAIVDAVPDTVDYRVCIPSDATKAALVKRATEYLIPAAA